MTTNYQKLKTNLEQLKLTNISENLDRYLENTSSILETLMVMTTNEIDYQKQTKIKYLTKRARFPQPKGLDEFDFSFQPSIDELTFRNLSTMNFLETAHNICLIGNSGVGKTHLAIALGTAACEQHIQTKFIVFHDLITTLDKAYHKGSLPLVMKRFINIKLLIIDEIGYVPITETQADWFYQLMSARYETHSTIITTNLPFSSWGKIFNNEIAAGAIVDRLIHHSKIFKITGQSYRLKDYHKEKEATTASN
ncbi:MAG: IS21-like element helper ATPase IstB [Lactobacillaceae bacterium]|jgi:DNA replication protein DnaC|nr:IS21-like element helper ATPase IstB [Lactobacillaceae bacterium]